jgi:hypothetical protein
LAEDDHAFDELGDLFDVMRDQPDADALFLKVAEDRIQFLARLQVESVGGLIQQQSAWQMHDGARNQAAAQLSSG